MKTFHYALRDRQIDRLDGEKIAADDIPKKKSASHCGIDMDAPVIAKSDDDLFLKPMRWGFPTGLPSEDLTGVIPPNVGKSLERCLVPFEKFAVWNPQALENTWFRAELNRPAYFAGYWTRWTGERRVLTHRKTPSKKHSLWSIFAIVYDKISLDQCEDDAIRFPKILSKDEGRDWLDGQKGADDIVFDPSRIEPIQA